MIIKTLMIKTFVTVRLKFALINKDYYLFTKINNYWPRKLSINRNNNN